MRAALTLLLFAGLPACTTAGATSLPSRAAVGEAARAWEAALCEPDETRTCAPAPRQVVLRRLRCVDAETEFHPGRVACIYSGDRVMGSGARLRFDDDCAYLARDAAGAWRILAIPDADVCTF